MHRGRAGGPRLDGLRADVPERGQREEQEAAVRHDGDARLRAARRHPRRSAPAGALSCGVGGSHLQAAAAAAPPCHGRERSHAAAWGREAAAHRAMSHCRKRRPRSMTAGSVSTRCLW